MRAHLLKAVVIVLLLPAGAAAQARMPHAGAGAVGGDVGVFLPRQDGMTNGPVLAGFYEYYLSARDSLRLGVGWLNPEQEANHEAKMRQIRFGGDIVHNWEGGSVHPFVGVGLAAYNLQPRVKGSNVGDSATKIGGNILGGVEFFPSGTFSIKGEASYHIVQKSGAYNPSGLALTIGAKAYF